MIESIEQRVLSGLHILLIEDASDLAASLSVFFRRAGARRVDVHRDAQSAQRQLKEMPAPDIVLLDYRLNGRMTGTELAAWMRQQPHLGETLRVSFSSAAREVVLSRAPDQGVYHAMISKPMRLAKVVAQIGELAQKRVTGEGEPSN